MNRYGYTVGASVLALAVSILPAAAFADNNSGYGGEVSAQAQAGIQLQDVSVSATGSAQAGEDNQGQMNGEDQQQSNDQASSSESARENAKQAMENARENAKQAFELMKENLPFTLDASTTMAFSLAQLKLSIQERKQELDQEEENASTSSDIQEAVKDANPVRLAVHALLASKELLGGIGPEVSQIAQEMNDSLATTTNAELKIQSRGFLTRLFFGGDSASAQAISEAVAQNQEHIQQLTDLLNQASTSADLKATIQAQITALEAAQAHLQALATSEQKAWGLFSWRF